MREELISFIWKFGLYRRSDLSSVHGEKITVLSPGELNRFDGPDFGNARIRVHGVVWSGAIELHYLSSDWYRHGHDQDPAYDQVVLHVCWVFDKEVHTCSGRIPVHVQLSDHVDEGIIHSLHQLWKGKNRLLCSSQFSSIPSLIMDRWIDRVGVMNFRKKVSDQLAMAQEEEQGPLIASRVRLGQILGIPGNKELLGQFVQRLDHGLISRRQDDLQFLIAYFLGQAGLIPLLGGDGYTRIVRSNYAHLKRLRPIEEIPWMWKTKGVRSGKLSTRLVSMAVFINVIGDLDDHSIEDDWDLKLVSLIKEVPDYWRSHSSLSELAQRGPFYFTSFIRVNLFINLILPHFLARLSEKNGLKPILYCGLL